MINDPKKDPACVGTDPEYFEIEPLYDTALGICAKCNVRLWCLQRMDPAKNQYDGVAGGHAWADGEILSRYSRPQHDPVVMTYLDSRRIPLRVRDSRLDRVAIRLFVEGDIAPDRLTLPELLEAAKQLIKAGHQNQDIVKATGLSWLQLTAVIQGMQSKR